MRTTLNIDENLLLRAQADTGAATRTATIEMGLRLLVQQAAARRLAAMGGQIPDATAGRRQRDEPDRAP